jgi:two-component system, OmpR family, response regulator MtrA
MANILVIEDEQAIANAYEIALSRAGHRVDLAADGSAAMQMVRPDHDVIILDMLMPGFSGLDFLKTYDVSSRRQHPTIIALSNIDTPSIMEQAKQLGAAEYILKVDLTPDQLVDVVAEHIHR